MSSRKRYAFSGMKIHPAISIAAIGVLAVPMLSPCTFGLGASSAVLLDKAGNIGGVGPLSHLPQGELRKWASKPGPPMSINTGNSVNRGLLFAESDFAGALRAPRPGSSLGHGAQQGVSSVLQSLSTLLAMTDGMMLGMIHEEGNGPIASFEGSGSDLDKRRQLVLSESPFVILQGEEVWFRFAADKKTVATAMASGRAKVTVITPQGTYFAIARKAHWHGFDQPLVLEGNPYVQTGSQALSVERADELVALDVKTRTISASGPVKESRMISGH